ncbi:MAG TPA: DUF4838 domain-containing protein [Candidatus Hydrogenedentes bacterium]|nr:DUF4838 domain-containing protein [Candidatus Hydrogenedentota bacterium]HQE82007.1 DUF4838 domain-containing protein [Candidatus Hydrogenedentota bacterium]HQH51668.1 DUF4838 domain-containing protein [Candidatus Hydrogenedentota bacterium]HQM47296.1 DUF4838 domain-containing protein [Candidatus Hydrogenedentota bacterium]
MTESIQDDPQPGAQPFFKTRGVVITPQDLTLGNWPERAKRAGLTTIALHPFPKRLIEFVESNDGQEFLDTCRELGLRVEYELHAMAELLPRHLFDKDPSLFRMTDEGERSPDANVCVHSAAALETVAANAARVGNLLRPTTGRYYFWGDDGKPWCRCPKCRELSDSDQALLLENAVVEALEAFDERAQLAHLAYVNTLAPPATVKPGPRVFLEFAPIRRRFDKPLDAPGVDENEKLLDLLDANLAVFPAETAQALEYWLDCSLFSQWKEPHVKLPWSQQVLEADLGVYGSRGIRHITTFAVYLDEHYLKTYGEPPIDSYGQALAAYQPG